MATVYFSRYGSGILSWATPMIIPPKDTKTVTKSTEVSSNTGSGNLPQAAVGMPVANVLGHKRVPDANTLWTGNLRALTETKTTKTSQSVVGADGTTVTTTVNVTTTTVVGYLVDIHMGICLGPDVHLLGVYVDNSPVWSGDIGPGRTTFTVGVNETFLSGAECVFSGGAFDQAPEPTIDVADYPGYVGVATILLKKVRADLPMGNLSFEVYRTPNPLGLSPGNNVSGHDLNPMSALVEVMTNDWGWGGLELGDIDVAKFSTMAAQLKDEGNFCSMKVGDSTSVQAVVKALQAQAAAIVFQHPETGLITGNLVRLDEITYSINSKRFGKSNIVDVQNYKKTWWPATVDQARGSYTNRDGAYDVPVFVQNSANLSQSGRGRKTLDIYYPYVTNSDLSQKLTSRDLARSSSPQYSLDLTVNREGADALPGEVVFVHHEDYNFIGTPMFVETVRKQPINNNTVVLKLSQAKLPNTVSLFGPGSGGPTPDFDINPKTPLGARVITAPYFFARRGRSRAGYDISYMVYPVILPIPANDLQFSFGVLQSNSPGAAGDTSIMSSALYPTYGKLSDAMSLYDGFEDGHVSSIDIFDVVNPTNLEEDIGTGGVREGRRFMIADNEILSFEKATNNGGGSWTLHDVYRGLVDTVAADHSVNAPVFVINNSFNNVGPGTDYPMSPYPEYVVIPNSIMRDGRRTEGLELDPWEPVPTLRVIAPTRPHDTRVNSLRSQTPTPITIGDPVTITWKTRNRLSASIPLQTDDPEPREQGISGSVTWDQQFRIFYLPPGGIIEEIGSGPYTGNSATFTMPTVDTGSGYILIHTEYTIKSTVHTNMYVDAVPVIVS